MTTPVWVDISKSIASISEEKKQMKTQKTGTYKETRSRIMFDGIKNFSEVISVLREMAGVKREVLEVKERVCDVQEIEKLKRKIS